MNKKNIRKVEQICPHWSTMSKSCLLQQEGLFIPVSEHVKIYCQNSNYLSCQQLLGRARTMGSPRREEGKENRRRHKRTLKRYYLRLSEYNPSALAEVPIDDCACTVDMSPGGIRLESSHSLVLDSLVSFYLDKKFSEVGLRGIGKVRWCKSLENTPLFHAGIDFIDEAAAMAIQQHLAVVVA